MKNYRVILVLVLLVFNTNAQNLVPNGDFEFYSGCPGSASSTVSITLASPWVDATGATSDYYNACAPVADLCSVPDQTIGLWQYANSGNAYAGLWAYRASGGEYREYIRVQLTSPMVAGESYKVSFYANLCNRLKFGCNNIGAYISSIPVSTTPPNVLNYVPQILLPGNPPIIDTVNWIQIAGSYTAVGGEKYITIGNFAHDSVMNIQVIDTSSIYNEAYYYIDDVEVSINTGIEGALSRSNFKIFPNPNNGSMTIEYHIGESEIGTVEVYDLTGRILQSHKIYPQENRLTINANELSPGQYYYAMRVNGTLVKTEKLTIIK